MPEANAEAPDTYPLRTRRLALGVLLVVWIAFDFPALAGRVLFPTDWDRSSPPRSLPEPMTAPSNPLEGDAYTLYYPLRDYLGQRLREGDLPLWDPHRFAGTPFAANSQTAVWYPPSWAFALGDTLAVYSWILVLSRLGALLLAYWFFRVLRLHPFAAAAGAVVFTFSGFLLAWGVHLTFPSSAMWLPLALGGLTLADRGLPRRGVPLAALGLALSLLGGHPQVTIFVWLVAGLWTAVLVGASMFDSRGSGSRPAIAAGLRAGGTLVVPFVLGGGLAALQVLGSLDFSEYTIRGVEDYQGLVSGAIPLRHLQTLLIPDRYGNPIDGNYAGPVNYTEVAVYAGVAALLMALYGLWRRRDRISLSFTLVGGVGLLAALGTPLYLILYSSVPGLSRMRGVARFVFLVDFAIAGLAAIGIDRLLRERRARPLPVIAGGLLAGIALATVAAGDDIGTEYILPNALLAGGVLLSATGLAAWIVRVPAAVRVAAPALVLLIAADLWLFGFPYHRFQSAEAIYRRDPGVEFIASQPGVRPRIARLYHYWLPPNAAMVHGLYDVQGYDNFIPARYVDLISIAEDQHTNAGGFNVVYNFEPPALASPVMDLLGVRSVLGGPTERSLGEPVYGETFRVFERAAALPAAFLAPCWERLPAEEVVGRLESMDADELRSIAILEDDVGSDPLPPPADGPCEPGPAADIVTYLPESVVVRATTTRQAVLVVSDTWDPGWEATVDGRPAPVLRVDRSLRGIVLPPGTHLVELSYRPGWLLPGAAITLTSALLLIGYWLRPSGSHRKR